MRHAMKRDADRREKHAFDVCLEIVSPPIGENENADTQRQVKIHGDKEAVHKKKNKEM